MRANEFVVENASAGATGSGSIATVAQPIGAVQRRAEPSFFGGYVTSDPYPNTPYKKKKKRRQT